MKLAVSNIAWENSRLSEHLTLLNQLGCDGVELAPSCIWPEPIEANISQRSALRKQIKDAGLELVGFHSLLYTRPDLQFFRDRHSAAYTVVYLEALARLCADLNGGLMILGSPANRVRHGRPYAECLDWAVDGLTRVADTCASLGVTLCIEPLGPDETDFIMSGAEGAEFVRRVAHPNFRLHLDAKALIATGEDPRQLLSAQGSLLHHFHASDPGLKPPGGTGFDHAIYGQALREIDYCGYVSIEMRRTGESSRVSVERSVAYVRRRYFGPDWDSVSND